MHRMLLKRISAFVVLLLLAACAAQTARVDEPVLHPLWVMESDHGKVYLLGSVHMLGPDQYPLPQVMQNAYRDSQVVAFETDVNAAKSPELQKQILAAALYKNGEMLKDHISPKLFAEVQDTLKRLGHHPNELSMFKPWFGAIALTLFDFQAAGNKTELGLDNHFSTKAKEDGKKIVYFEKPGFQINLLISLAGEDQEEFLKQTLKELQINGAHHSSRLLALWQAGDAKGMYKLLSHGFRDAPEMEEKFLNARNRDWLPQIERLAQGKGNALVVVGAGHLVGPKGVVSLLKAKGYHIRQL